MGLNEIYKKKVDACIKGLELLEIDINNILEKYNNTNFPNTSISKFNLFQSILINLSYSNEQEKYMNEVCGNLTRFRDRRTGVEYAIDLIIGWISEDGLLKYFININQEAVLSGNDRYREFLNPRQISAQSDIILSGKSSNFKLEYMNDWTNTWKNRNHLDLRENKYLKLLDEKAIFLGISPLSQQALVINFGNIKNNTSWERIAAHFPYGGKPAWQLKNPKDLILPLNKSLQQVLNIINE